jgi:hypothetical protein
MFDSLSMIFLLELEDQPMGKVFALEFVPEFIESMLKGPNGLHKEGPSAIRERMLAGFKLARS